MSKIRFHILLMFMFFFSFPACSSDNEMERDELGIHEKKDSTSDDSANPSNNAGSSFNSNQFKIEPYFSLTKGGGSQQGAALYGDYLFHATSSNAVHIYNMKEKNYITMLKMGTMGHADTMSFGIQKVEENDEFPVMYVSGSQSNTAGKGGDIYVYRIVRTISEMGAETWKGTLIQHIITPDVSIVGSFPDIVIDRENITMWMMGWLTNFPYNHDDGSGCTNCLSKYEIPDIHEGVQDSKGIYQLTLTEDDRLSYFLIYDIHAITQGLCYYNGKIFCPYGNSFKGIDVIDLSKEKLIYYVNLKGSRIGEPEAIVIYEDKLYLLGQGDYVYSCSGLDL